MPSCRNAARSPTKSSCQFDLLVGRGVHEHELVALLVEELELPSLDLGLLDPVGGAEALVELAAVEQVLQLDLVVGRALAGLHRAGLDRGPERAVVLDHHAGPDVAAADLGHESCRFAVRSDAAGAVVKVRRRGNIASRLIGAAVVGRARWPRVGPTRRHARDPGLGRCLRPAARSSGFCLRMKSSRNRSLSPPALAIRCQRTA